jgi:hypothetical protein
LKHSLKKQWQGLRPNPTRWRYYLLIDHDSTYNTNSWNIKTKTKNIKLGFLKENCVRIFLKILYLKPSQAEEYSVTYLVFFSFDFCGIATLFNPHLD